MVCRDKDSCMDEFTYELNLLRSEGLKDSHLRLEYEEIVHELIRLPDRLRQEGKTEEENWADQSRIWIIV